jgi:hypothetical protein
MPARHAGSEFDGLPHEAQSRVAARAADRRQSRRDASRQHAGESQGHRQRHERCDDDVEQDADGAHHVKPCGDHRRRHRPDGCSDDEQFPGLAAETSQQPLGGRAATIDEPCNRIGLRS